MSVVIDVLYVCRGDRGINLYSVLTNKMGSTFVGLGFSPVLTEARRNLRFLFVRSIQIYLIHTASRSID